MNTRRFEAKAAARSKVPLLVGLVGPSSSGKTFSALRLATGMQRVCGGKIFVIDTEAGRALHYADDFAFEHVAFAPPFGSLDYLAAIAHCIESGASVIVVDSMTHEHNGEGGMLERHAAEAERLAKTWKTTIEAVNFSAWAEPKAARRKLTNYILQAPANFILCYRAREKLEIAKGSKPKRLGLMPEGDESFMFEMGVSALFRPMCGGIPDWDPREPGERMWVKLPRQFRATFSNSEPMSEAHGEQLATWASGKSLASSAQFDELMHAIARAASVADLEDLTAQLAAIPKQRSLPPAQYKQLRQSWSRRRDELASGETYDVAPEQDGERSAIAQESV